MLSITATDGTAIHYESYGSGKPIILVHGWGISRVWQAQIAAFSKTHRVITVDLRGHGGSGSPRGNFTLDALRDDLLTLIRTLELKGVAIVAWSMGASVAIRLMAELRPEEVASLIIVAGTPMLTASYHKEGGKTIISRKKGLIETLFLLVKRYSLEIFRQKGFLKERLWIITKSGLWANLRTLWGYMMTMADTDLTSILGRIDVPTLVIHGDRDILCPVEGASYMAERIKGARLEILEGADHTLVLTGPEDVNRKILEFIPA